MKAKELLKENVKLENRLAILKIYAQDCIIVGKRDQEHRDEWIRGCGFAKQSIGETIMRIIEGKLD